MTWTGNSVCGVNTLGCQYYLQTLLIRWKNILSQNKISFFEMRMSVKIEQAKIIMNENVASSMDPEGLAMSWILLFMVPPCFKEYTGYAPAKISRTETS